MISVKAIGFPCFRAQASVYACLCGHGSVASQPSGELLSSITVNLAGRRGDHLGWQGACRQRKFVAGRLFQLLLERQQAGALPNSTASLRAWKLACC
ncbi:MAG: hypothetical protein CL397_07860 [Acidiferrobacteraceae bacterium]|nr:hypothetical protein [Acidiferrobacteraceae bacterium]